MHNRVFKDEKKLKQMFGQRQKGFDIVSLGIIYGADFTTINYHCKKQHIKKEGNLSFKIPAFLSVFDIRPRSKKSYSDYLSDERRRRNERFSQLISS